MKPTCERYCALPTRTLQGMAGTLVESALQPLCLRCAKAVDARGAVIRKVAIGAFVGLGGYALLIILTASLLLAGILAALGYQLLHGH